jgi:hypothetical protein
MDSILDTLKAFETNHIFWAPEQFQDIYDEDMRKTVRAAFRTSDTFIQTLVTTGTANDMDDFVSALRTKASMMTAVTLAELLHTLYTFEQQGVVVSKETVKWYRSKGWAFPPFAHEVS